uniref:Uncharacterized protein n=1 Tax=Panagrolaimus sp. JU765 TaxID=591449 RepID=A0AC34QLY6_9BILA
MDDDFCFDCISKEFRFEGLIPRKVVSLTVIVGERSKDHGCVREMNNFKNHVKVAENLPSVNFSTSDYVLKRRLYEISTPIMKKKLWNCSKKTAHLGKKVVSYIVTKVWRGDMLSERLLVHEWNQDAVIDLRKGLELEGVQLEKARRFIDYNYTSLQLEHVFYDTAMEFCNDNVYKASLQGVHCAVGIFTNQMPNLDVLIWKDPIRLMPGWERYLPRNFEHVIITASDPLEYDLLASYLDIQRFSFIMEIRLDKFFNSPKLHTYFRPKNAGEQKPRLLLRWTDGYTHYLIGDFVTK